MLRCKGQDVNCAVLRQLLLIWFCAFSSSAVIAQQYGFDNFSLEEGLPQSGVYDMIQDRQGYLWVATEGGGVARFDGVAFDVWDESLGLSDPIVRCLYEDQAGTLWMGTSSQGLYYLDKNRDSVRHVAGSNDLHIRNVVEDESGHLWIGTIGEGLLTLQDDSLKSADLSIPSDNVRASLRASNGDLWFGTDAGLIRLTKSGELAQLQDSSATAKRVLCLHEDYNQQVWVGTAEGVARVRENSILPFAPEVLRGERIRAISHDKYGQMWFGTREGLYRCVISSDEYELPEFEFIGRNNGLSNERIRKLYLDHHNALWVGTYFGGICRLMDQNFQYFTSDQGWPENNVTAIYQDAHGHVWLGTYDGSVYQVKGETVQKRYISPVSWSDDFVRDFEEIDNEEVWACTASGRLEKYSHGEYTGLASLGTQVKVNNISTFLNYPLVCTENRGIWWHGIFYDADSLGACQSAVATEEGKLLVGTRRGLWEFEPGKKHLVPLPETSTYNITCMSPDHQGNIWCGTAGSGLVKYSDGKVRTVRGNRYLSSQQINFVQLDPNDNLWVGTRKGLDFLELTPDQSMVLNHTFFGSDLGFKGGETNRGASFVDSRGQLWMGTVRGVVRHSIKERVLPPTPPYLRFTSVLLGDTIPDWSQFDVPMDPRGLPVDPVFGPDDESITFNYKAIDLNSPRQVTYQFILEGYESDWSAEGSTMNRRYSNLPAGSYTFKVRSRGVQGLWNDEPVAFSFAVRPPVYLQPGFMIGAILFLVLLIYFVFRVRLRILEAEKKKLELKVAERTVELQDEKQKSEDLLLNILPQETAKELMEDGAARARHHHMASVLFSDFKGFTHLSEKLEAAELVDLLDTYFRAFDQRTAEFNIEKIKTIGDAYMCATGIPAEDPDHALNLVRFALNMLEITQRINDENRRNNKPIWELRIGIHSGPVVSGVVGEKKFAYDIWGDTVNLAARMESSGEEGRINVSASTYELIKDQFDCEARGKIEAKNKGSIDMFFVTKPK